MTMKFSDLIPVNANICVVGGGGKTGLIEALEGELHAAGRLVLTSVTTRLGRWQLAHLERIEAETLAEARAAARRAEQGERLFLAGPFAPDNLTLDKYAGLPLDWFRPLRRSLSRPVTFLVEADGSAGLPLKCHRPNEPVLPPLPNFVAAVLGLSVLTRPWTEAVHRPEIFREQVPPPADDLPLSPAQVADYVLAAWTRFSPGLIFLNQADEMTGPARVRAGRELAGRLAADGWRVVLGSLHQQYCERF